MIVTSTSGRPYARFLSDAQGENHLDLHPNCKFVAGRIVILNKFAFVPKEGWPDPKQLSKFLLSTGVEQSERSIRGILYVMTHTKVTDVKSISAFTKMAAFVASKHRIISNESIFQDQEVHPEFVDSYSKLLESDLSSIWPVADPVDKDDTIGTLSKFGKVAQNFKFSGAASDAIARIKDNVVSLAPKHEDD